MRREFAVAIGALLLLVTATACGVPASGGFKRVSDADVPWGLSETTTSTTSTTSTTMPPSTSTTPPSSIPSTSSTEPETTTTVPSELVALFFVVGPVDSPTLQRVDIALASGPSPQLVINALTNGPPRGSEYPSLRSAIPVGTVLGVTVLGGVATVELPPTFVAEVTGVSGTAARTAIAQIVLTLTQRGGIGQVNFTSGGLPQQVPIGDGSFTGDGQAVSCEDYVNLTTGFACS